MTKTVDLFKEAAERYEALIVENERLKEALKLTEPPEFPDLVGEWDELMMDRARPSAPAQYNRASSIGHPCMRALYLERVGADKKVPDLVRQNIFNMGEEIERAVVIRLGMRGYQVERAQETLEGRSGDQVLYRGHPDGLIRKAMWPDKQWLWDGKSCHANIWSQIPDDPFEAGKWIIGCDFPWMRKYNGQLQAYMYAYKQMDVRIDGAILIFVNKQTGQEKQANVRYEEAAVRVLAQKCSAINQYVEDGEVPTCLNDSRVCAYCDFYQHGCHPEITIRGANIVDDIPSNMPIFKAAKEYLALTDHIAPYKKAEKARKRIKEAFANMDPGKYYVPELGELTLKESKNGARSLTIKAFDEEEEI